jgi:hypothetical protein
MQIRKIMKQCKFSGYETYEESEARRNHIPITPEDIDFQLLEYDPKNTHDETFHRIVSEFCPISGWDRTYAYSQDTDEDDNGESVQYESFVREAKLMRRFFKKHPEWIGKIVGYGHAEYHHDIGNRGDGEFHLVNNYVDTLWDSDIYGGIRGYVYCYGVDQRYGDIYDPTPINWGGFAPNTRYMDGRVIPMYIQRGNVAGPFYARVSKASKERYEDAYICIEHFFRFGAPLTTLEKHKEKFSKVFG